MCVYFGETVKDLRRLGIRTVIDLQALTPSEIKSLPADTSVTETILVRAGESVKNSPEIARLREIGELLGIFGDFDNRRGAALPNAISGTPGGAGPDR